MTNVIHIEPSSRCTLACPQCPRTEHVNLIPIEDCDIENTVRACQDHQIVLMCGNHGDPIYHASFHDLVRRMKASRADRVIQIITNGAFRSESWWERLAAMLDNPRDMVTFSIDGMPDTNHIYRVNSRWSTIEHGARTLRRCNPNLMMIWKWILFRYNEQQIMPGIELARDIGFDKFILVNSMRYQDGHFLTPTMTYDEIKENIRRCASLHDAK